jgi:hypothetical protein
MLNTTPQNSTVWYSWSLNSDNPTGGAKYIKEGVSPEAAESNSFSHRFGVFLIRCFFIASSMVYWCARQTKPSMSAKDLIIGIFIALSLTTTVTHMVLSSKESTLKLLMYCNMSNIGCQIIVLVCLFYGVSQSQVSPLNLAMLTALMVGETSNSRSILACIIVGILLLAIDPSSQTDYSSVVVAIVGLFCVFAFLSYQLRNTAPRKRLMLQLNLEPTLRTEDDYETTSRGRRMLSPVNKPKSFYGAAFGGEKKIQVQHSRDNIMSHDLDAVLPEKPFGSFKEFTKKQESSTIVIAALLFSKTCKKRNSR